MVDWRQLLIYARGLRVASGKSLSLIWLGQLTTNIAGKSMHETYKFLLGADTCQTHLSPNPMAADILSNLHSNNYEL